MPKDLDSAKNLSGAKNFSGAKNLSGDSPRLDQDGSPRLGFRIWIALAIVLGAIALAVWRHAG
jgi:hypothetical protein